jgi:hypothetical protein
VAFSVLAPLVDVAVEVDNAEHPIVRRVLCSPEREDLLESCPVDLQNCQVTPSDEHVFQAAL